MGIQGTLEVMTASTFPASSTRSEEFRLLQVACNIDFIPSGGIKKPKTSYKLSPEITPFLALGTPPRAMCRAGKARLAAMAALAALLAACCACGARPAAALPRGAAPRAPEAALRGDDALDGAPRALLARVKRPVAKVRRTWPNRVVPSGAVLRLYRQGRAPIRREVLTSWA